MFTVAQWEEFQNWYKELILDDQLAIMPTQTTSEIDNPTNDR